MGQKPNEVQIWVLSNYLATEDANDENLNALPTTNREQQKIDENQDQSDFELENVQDSDEPFLVVKNKQERRRRR